MAYDRYDARNDPRGDRARWRDDRNEDRGWRSRDRGEDRGFFERAGDEIASWFGDDDADRRRHQDRMRDEREDRFSREFGRSGEDRGRFWRDRSWDQGDFERDEGRFREFGRDRGYRPMTGDYGRSEQFFPATGPSRGRFGRDEERFHEEERFRRDRSQSPFSRDEFRRTSRFENPHYSSWRQRHMDELDRDYDDYARENQSRFEDDFGNWRQRRQQKRGLLGQVREHMEVVGSDDEHVGTIDRVAGDRIILTKSDPEAGGAHHSLSCSDIDRVEGDRIILDCKADQARERWRDESRSRALFEREDQGEMGPHILDRSFEGTYR